MTDQTTTRESSTNRNTTPVNRNSKSRGKSTFWGNINSNSKRGSADDDKISIAYEKLHHGIVVNKLGRNGKIRATTIKLSKNKFFLSWHSKVMSFKVGRTNRGMFSV